MAYTAKLLSKKVDLNANRVIYLVEFTDGQQVFNAPLNLALYTPVEQVKQIIKERIEEYEKADVILPALTEGPVDLSGVMTGITPERAELRVFLGKKNKLEQLNAIKNLSFLTGAKATALDTAITNLKADMQTDFKVTFIDLF